MKGDLPVIMLPATAFGPCGVAIPLGPEPDAGGGTEPKTFMIPILDLGHYDERQGCGFVHDYLHAHDYAADTPQPDAADLPAFRACRSYRNGQCGGNGWKDPCLFLEAPTAEGWKKARRWRLLPSGGICFAESYAWHVAHERDYPKAKPWADAVAYAFGIEVDEAGAVVEDDLVETDRWSLRLALKTALYHEPAADDLEAILTRYWPGDDDQVTTPASHLYGALCEAALLGYRRREGIPEPVETTATVGEGGKA